MEEDHLPLEDLAWLELVKVRILFPLLATATWYYWSNIECRLHSAYGYKLPGRIYGPFFRKLLCDHEANWSTYPVLCTAIQINAHYPIKCLEPAQRNPARAARSLSQRWQLCNLHTGSSSYVATLVSLERWTPALNSCRPSFKRGFKKDRYRIWRRKLLTIHAHGLSCQIPPSYIWEPYTRYLVRSQ